jgi:hypothetical protein
LELTKASIIPAAVCGVYTPTLGVKKGGWIERLKNLSRRRSPAVRRLVVFKIRSYFKNRTSVPGGVIRGFKMYLLIPPLAGLRFLAP